MDIEDDIKKVNNLIERCKECKFAACEQCEISYTEVKAIAHILAEREELKSEIQHKCEQIFLTDREIDKRYISKQKVEEKK